VILDEIEVASGSKIDVPFGDVLLDAGNHTLRVTMINDLNIFLGGQKLVCGTGGVFLSYVVNWFEP